jgi:HEAT repeat protein
LVVVLADGGSAGPAAAAALARLGREGTRELGYALKAGADPVRLAVADALGESPAAARQTERALREALRRDGHAGVRERAADALSR